MSMIIPLSRSRANAATLTTLLCSPAPGLRDGPAIIDERTSVFRAASCRSGRGGSADCGAVTRWMSSVHVTVGSTATDVCTALVAGPPTVFHAKLPA
jgi:hypothetical protein